MALLDPGEDYRLKTVRGQVKSFFPEGPMFFGSAAALRAQSRGSV